MNINPAAAAFPSRPLPVYGGNLLLDPPLCELSLEEARRSAGVVVSTPTSAAWRCG